MSDSTGDLAPSAGAMLRSAREKRGVHIAALAASIKVPQRKLEALEADRYDELLDLTFTRALAQSVCRTLKIDMQPVLDRLPQDANAPTKLARVGGSLNTPFRERPGREETADWGWLKRPVVWGTALVLVAAALLALSPQTWLNHLARLRGAAPAASAADGAASAVITLPATPLSPTMSEPPGAASASTINVPAMKPTSATSTTPMFGSPPVLGLKASTETWVEVQDAHGQVMLSRKLAAGETAGVDGDLPLRVTIGNAVGTQVTFRGQPVDLSANTLGNVARIQLN